MDNYKFQKPELITLSINYLLQYYIYSLKMWSSQCFLPPVANTFWYNEHDTSSTSLILSKCTVLKQ